MANDFRVNLYERSTEQGVTGIRPVPPSGTGGGGWSGQRQMRGIKENVTVVLALGLSLNDNQVFEVKMNGGRRFITDWAGIGNFDLIRVNKYTQTLQPEGTDFEGTNRWQYFGIGARSSARVYVPNVASCVSLQQNGVNESGVDQGEECFRVTMIDGETFVTDRSGWDNIQGWL